MKKIILVLFLCLIAITSQAIPYRFERDINMRSNDIDSVTTLNADTIYVLYTIDAHTITSDTIDVGSMLKIDNSTYEAGDILTVVNISIDTTLTARSDTLIPSQAAIENYVNYNAYNKARFYIDPTLCRDKDGGALVYGSGAPQLAKFSEYYKPTAVMWDSTMIDSTTCIKFICPIPTDALTDTIWVGIEGWNSAGKSVKYTASFYQNNFVGGSWDTTPTSNTNIEINSASPDIHTITSTSFSNIGGKTFTVNFYRNEKAEPTTNGYISNIWYEVKLRKE
jgi:hypothetical protein